MEWNSVKVTPMHHILLLFCIAILTAHQLHNVVEVGTKILPRVSRALISKSQAEQFVYELELVLKRVFCVWLFE